MSVAADCPACMAGDHERHDARHGLRVGLIGGTYCACTGDCAERFAEAGQALRDLLPPMTADETRDAQSGVEAVFREHWFHDGGNVCECGYWAEFDSVKRHHLEDSLAAELAPLLAAERAKALREAADEMEATIDDLKGDVGSELSYINCTRIDVRMLRNRADREQP